MDLHFSEADEAFRKEIAQWLAENLTGEFAQLRGRGGPGDEHALVKERHLNCEYDDDAKSRLWAEAHDFHLRARRDPKLRQEPLTIRRATETVIAGV